MTISRSDGQARRELVRIYRLLRLHGYNDSHSGNASVRSGDRVWITPTGACADRLLPRDLVECALPHSISKHASADAALHLAIYRKRTDVGAIIHAHNPYTVALTLDGKDFCPSDFEGHLYFESIPVISIPYADYFRIAPEAVSQALEECNLLVVCGHGVYAAGETLDQAYKWICSAELSAKTAYLARVWSASA